MVLFFFQVIQDPGVTKVIHKTLSPLRFKSVVFIPYFHMSDTRGNPLSYNRWARGQAKKTANKYEYWEPSEIEPELKLNLPPIPVGSDESDPGYEFECPAQSWISLVEACRVEAINERRDAVLKVMFLAKNSHWTQTLYEEELHLLDAEYGGDLEQEGDPLVSPPPCNPCATCGVDTGSDRMFCESHDE